MIEESKENFLIKPTWSAVEPLLHQAVVNAPADVGKYYRLRRWRTAREDRSLPLLQHTPALKQTGQEHADELGIQRCRGRKQSWSD